MEVPSVLWNLAWVSVWGSETQVCCSLLYSTWTVVNEQASKTPALTALFFLLLLMDNIAVWNWEKHCSKMSLKSRFAPVANHVDQEGFKFEEIFWQILELIWL